MDEKKTKSPNYHSPESKDSGHGSGRKGVSRTDLEKLVGLAHSLGASSACIISAGDIVVEDFLAGFCSDGRCKNYGLSNNCPPYNAGPLGFRELQKAFKSALVIRMDVVSSALFSDEHGEIIRSLHKIVAGIERAAIEAGYTDSKAFAGGSCREIFCCDYEDCSALSEEGKCRHPQYARPSMSGFGINVSELMKTCGWSSDINVRKADSSADSMSWVAGLILIG